MVLCVNCSSPGGFVLRSATGLALGVVLALHPSLAASNAPAPAPAPMPAAADTTRAKSTVPAPLIAVVSVNDQRVTIWSGNNSIARSAVSTGASGHRTPTGVFSVIGKERYHESNLYSDAPMPFMQRITWSGVALHAGHLPGYAASHGCIRMPEDFAQRLFGMTRTGMRVIVTDRDVSPIGIAHPSLPVPTFVHETQVASIASSMRTAAFAAPSTAGSVAEPTASSLPGRMQLGGPSQAMGRLLNPMERGKLEQGYTKILALEAEADAHALLDVAAVRSSEARAAADHHQSVTAAVSALAAGYAKAIEAAADNAATDDQRARAEASRMTLRVALQSAHQRQSEARETAAASDAAAFHAAGEAKAAVEERDALQDAARIAERATEPVSIFVSRRDHKVYVRQGFEPVF